MPVRGVRGATTVTRNVKEDILEATGELLKVMVEVNDIDADEIASAWITTTPDIYAEFPAVAARHQLGWSFVPLMQSHEMSVPGMLPMCIRVLLHWNTEKGIRDIHHVYLREASRLRPDLASSTHSTAR
jgi:chorismate mutase